MKFSRAIVDLFSSVRLGIVLLIVLFFYMSVGSAGIVYPVHPNIFHPDAWMHDQLRQWRPFEMTEFEWFHWWPFDLMLALIATNMIVTTIRRIPLRPVNYGVWMIHAGILVLLGGSFIYFHYKVEGDAPVARRKVVLKLDTVADPVELLASEGASAFIGTGSDRLTVQVESVDPAWKLRSGGDDGQVGYSVQISVTSASKRFIRQLIAGHPEYTEDLVFTNDPSQPMKRAIKETGNAIIEPRLSAELDYESQGYFYLRNDLTKAWALYVRQLGTSQWSMRPIDGMPLYNDRISSASEVFESGPGPALVIDPISIAVPAVESNDPCPDVTFSVTGYLRFAQTRSRLVPGGPDAAFNPVASIDVSSADGGKANYRLAALDPERSTGDGGLIRMVCVNDETGFKRLVEKARLHITIPGANVDIVEPVKVAKGEGEPPFTPIGNPELGYGYRVLAAQDDLPVAQRVASVLVVDIKTPSKTVRRWVFDDESLTRDIPEAASGAHATPIAPDPIVKMEYLPGGGRALLTLAVGPSPEQLRWVISFGDSDAKVVDAPVGTEVTLPAGLNVRVSSYEQRAVVETRPMIVPPEQRSRDAREMYSQALVSIPSAGSRWMEYSHYAFDDVRFALRRHPFHPQRVRLADGRELEILFSRERRPLNTEVALEEFVLATHDGGYTGEASTIRNYTSMLRFKNGQSWGDPIQVSVNEPVEHEGLWYFQAQWDPPDPPSGDGDRGSAGLNYTVLGVGNRHGVWIQLAGCVIAVVGMIYAFYIKPVLIRRRTRMAQVACALLALCVAMPCRADGDTESFYAAVDLSPLNGVAVQTQGRIKSFASFAQEEMAYVSGPRKIAGHSPTFTMLDMLIRPDAYADADVIFVKGDVVRAPIAQALLQADPSLASRMEGFMKWGLISESLLSRPEVEPVLRQMQSDLLRTSKSMDAVRSARTVMRPDFLIAQLRVVPPAPGDSEGRWSSLREVMLLAADPSALKASGETAQPIPGLDEEGQRKVAGYWKAVVEGWSDTDPAKVNSALASLALALPALNPTAYPDGQRLQWESWYFANGNLVWIWLIYALSVVLLLLGVVYRWGGARIAGLAVFAAAFLLQTGALGLRWWIAQRWPNANMFEAVTTAAWFGGCCAVLLEWFLRKSQSRGLFALASAFSSAVALMAAHFLPVQLNAQVSNMMPVLHDVWLYIHTNVIILSYCLIFMAAVSAVLYLGYRALGGKAVFARVGAVSDGALAAQAPTLSGEKLGEVLDGVTMLLMKLSFVLLWTGIAMGAIWADHSWGRPWGWDPKEVFALNTFVVFAVLVHVRWRVKDKGFWTAVLAVVGAAVMLFNWIVINFIITGLHSYA